MNEGKALKNDMLQSETIRDYLKVIFTHKVLIVSIVTVVMLTIFISLSLYTPTNEATVKMMIEGQKTTEAEYYDKFVFPGKALIEGEIIKSDHVVGRVVDALRLQYMPFDYERKFSSKLKAVLIRYRAQKHKKELEKFTAEQREALLFAQAKKQLTGNISVLQIKDSGMFNLRVRHFSPKIAVLVANSLSRSYVIFDLERQLVEIQLKYGDKHAIIKQLRDKIQDMSNYLDGRLIPAIEAIGPARVKIIDQAQNAVPNMRYNKKMLLVIGFFISVILGFIASYVLESLDQTIKSPKDVETFLNMPFLGSIPKIKSKDKLLVDGSTLNAHCVDHYQYLSDKLELLIQEKKIKSVLLADVNLSGDVANVIANISICLARKYKTQKVLVVDANLRNFSLSKVFNINGIPGISEVLEGKILFEDVVQHIESNLDVLAAGHTEINPTTLLNSSKMTDIIKSVKGKYDVVFFASANLNNFTDSIIISSFIDACILVLSEGKVRRQIVKHSIASLEQKKINLIGAIINNKNLVIPKFIYDHL